MNHATRAVRLVLIVAVTAGATIAGVRLLDGDPAVPARGPVYPASWSRLQTVQPLPTDWVPAPSTPPSCPSSPDPRRPAAVRAWLADPANAECAEHLGLTREGDR